MDFKCRRFATVGLLWTALAGGTGAALAQDGPQYEIKVTNLTRGQQFTPILAASHKAGVKLFELGSPASAPLATLAEEGATAPLAALLAGMPEVLDVAACCGLTAPGGSSTITVKTRAGFDHISVAAMLIPTNDAFFAINGAEGPEGSHTLTLYSPAYDSGTERNDELCASIPGPFFTECGGAGGGMAPSGGEEGYVHIHAGMHGIGSMTAAVRDWRNPVAKVTIRRIP